jgi:hypothetical protein
VVSGRVAVDNWRQSRRISDEPIPEHAGTVDVARAVEGRVTLHAVRTAMDRLSDDDRSAIASGLMSSVSVDRKTDVRDGVRRHRARGRLRAMTNGLVAWIGWLVGWRRSARSTARKVVALAGPSMVVTAFFLVPAISPHPGGRPPTAVPTLTPQHGGHATIQDADVSRPATRRSGSGPGSAAGHEATRSGVGPRAVPPAGAEVPTPGDRAAIGERPKSDGDHFVCASAGQPTPTCVDPPLPHVVLP